MNKEGINKISIGKYETQDSSKLSSNKLAENKNFNQKNKSQADQDFLCKLKKQDESATTHFDRIMNQIKETEKRIAKEWKANEDSLIKVQRDSHKFKDERKRKTFEHSKQQKALIDFNHEMQKTRQAFTAPSRNSNESQTLNRFGSEQLTHSEERTLTQQKRRQVDNYNQTVVTNKLKNLQLNRTSEINLEKDNYKTNLSEYFERTSKSSKTLENKNKYLYDSWHNQNNFKKLNESLINMEHKKYQNQKDLITTPSPVIKLRSNKTFNQLCNDGIKKNKVTSGDQGSFYNKE